MKKIIVAVISLLTITGSCFAQTAPAKAATTKSSKPAVASTSKMQDKPMVASNAKTTTVKTTSTKPATVKAAPATAATTPAVASSAPLKKDGTVDKRYKAKTAPVKKDGTPDMRYKENKKAKS